MPLTTHKRRIVVGDIHGELEGLKEILNHAGLIDSHGTWSGGDSQLIQTGDVIDRGLYSLECIDLLRQLQKEAIGDGGKVIRLCGNHELMLIHGDFRYVNFNEPNTLVNELKVEIAQGNVLASYSDGERLYTHAGLRSAIRESLVAEMMLEKQSSNISDIDLFYLSDHINNIFRGCVESGDLDQHPIFYVGFERGGDVPVGGIFWCDFSKISPSMEAWKIPQIFGHTPTGTNSIKSAQGLKLIDIDAGMCREYGGTRVYLEITQEGHLLQYSKVRSKWETTPLGVHMTFMEDVRVMAQDMDENEREEFLAMAEQIDREEDEFEQRKVIYLCDYRKRLDQKST